VFRSEFFEVTSHIASIKYKTNWQHLFVEFFLRYKEGGYYLVLRLLTFGGGGGL